MLKILDKYSYVKDAFFIFFTPIIFLWVLMIGGQYNVGTDYPSYLQLFETGANMERLIFSHEYVFAYFIKFCWFLGIKGQGIFFIISLIEVVVLFKIMTSLFDYKNLHVFFFVFICFSTILNNQMNGVRQYFCMYLFTLSTLFLLEKKRFYWFILVVICAGIHKSSILLILFQFVFVFFKNLRNRYILVSFVCVGFIVSNLPLTENIQKILPLLSYEHYVGHKYLSEIKFQDKLIKFSFIPFYLFAIYKSKFIQLNYLQRSFFNIGVISFAMRLLTLNMTLLNRFGMFFEFLMIFPLVILLTIKVGNKTKYINLVLYILLFLIYTLKVTFLASREYLYDSIYM